MAYARTLRTEHGANWDYRLAWDDKRTLKHECDKVRRRRERAELDAFAHDTCPAWGGVTLAAKRPLPEPTGPLAYVDGQVVRL